MAGGVASIMGLHACWRKRVAPPALSFFLASALAAWHHRRRPAVRVSSQPVWPTGSGFICMTNKNLDGVPATRQAKRIGCAGRPCRRRRAARLPRPLGDGVLAGGGVTVLARALVFRTTDRFRALAPAAGRSGER